MKVIAFSATGELVAWSIDGGQLGNEFTIKSGSHETSIEEMLRWILPNCPFGSGPTGETVKITVELVP